jgi:hypothetical protein
MSLQEEVQHVEKYLGIMAGISVITHILNLRFFVNCKGQNIVQKFAIWGREKRFAIWVRNLPDLNEKVQNLKVNLIYLNLI